MEWVFKWLKIALLLGLILLMIAIKAGGESGCHVGCVDCAADAKRQPVQEGSIAVG